MMTKFDCVVCKKNYKELSGSNIICPTQYFCSQKCKENYTDGIINAEKNKISSYVLKQITKVEIAAYQHRIEVMRLSDITKYCGDEDCEKKIIDTPEYIRSCVLRCNDRTALLTAFFAHYPAAEINSSNEEMIHLKNAKEHMSIYN